MAAEPAQRGAAVEAAARVMLEKSGLRWRASNVRYSGGELDLVMEDPADAGLVFVEVRYRRTVGFGGGAASVDIGKRRKLVHAAQRYLAQHPALANRPCRFDVVDARGEPPQLDWIRDAFRADDC
ncbi:MAG: YraN family protein [Stenotrophomonas sp.]|uniref:YraN family protein n=1 Tax=Stenotrophomonas sp. TaxID=69392 RepID=UPI0028A5A598|nr:YraN family protein [Stenotrophomonas sp.]